MPYEITQCYLPLRNTPLDDVSLLF